jgi:hypothetical protein
MRQADEKYNCVGNEGGAYEAAPPCSAGQALAAIIIIIIIIIIQLDN